MVQEINNELNRPFLCCKRVQYLVGPIIHKKLIELRISRGFIPRRDANGTERTPGHVRYGYAMGCKADVAGRSFLARNFYGRYFGRDWGMSRHAKNAAKSRV